MHRFYFINVFVVPFKDILTIVISVNKAKQACIKGYAVLSKLCSSISPAHAFGIDCDQTEPDNLFTTRPNDRKSMVQRRLGETHQEQEYCERVSAVTRNWSRRLE